MEFAGRQENLRNLVLFRITGLKQHAEEREHRNGLEPHHLILSREGRCSRHAGDEQQEFDRDRSVLGGRN